MIIHCPNCDFERKINADVVPADAVMATCPKCQHRFMFRSLNEDAAHPATANRESVSSQPSPQATEAVTAVTEHPDDALSMVSKTQNESVKADSTASANDKDCKECSKIQPDTTQADEAGVVVIHCPKCDFERTINADTVPTDAVMATCPKCLHRFQFRSKNADDTQKSEANSDESKASQSIPTALAAEDKSTPEIGTVSAKSSVPSDHVSDTPAENDDLRLGEHTAFDEKRESSSEQDKTGWNDDSPLKLSPTTTDPADNDAGSASRAKGDVPWEMRNKYGVFGGFYQTILQVLFRPERFFSAIPDCKGGVASAVVFSLILGMLQTVAKLFLIREALAPMMADPQVQGIFGSSQINWGLMLTLAPILLYIQLYFYTALFTLMIKLVDPEKVRFVSVLRVVAYSSATSIMCLIPGLGMIVSVIWFAVSCFIGCRYALGISWKNTALALLPLYAIALAINVQTVLQLSAM